MWLMGIQKNVEPVSKTRKAFTGLMAFYGLIKTERQIAALPFTRSNLVNSSLSNKPLEPSPAHLKELSNLRAFALSLSVNAMPRPAKDV
jgi:hypothetical protein